MKFRKLACNKAAIFSSAVLLGALVPALAYAAAGAPIAFAPQLALLAYGVCAGLCLRQVGLVRRQSALTADAQCLVAFLAAAIGFLPIGFNLLRTVTSANAVVPDVIGEFAVAPGQGGAGALPIEIAAIATAALALTGALSERIRLLPLALFVLILSGLLIPIAASWQWGGGWLFRRGFFDFGGATLIHSAAGWAALAGALVAGGRTGRFNPAHQIEGKEHHALPIAAIGTGVLLIGWQGLIGGIGAASSSGFGASAFWPMLMRVDVAAAAGGLVALLAARFAYPHALVATGLNGVVAGLVAISAAPAAASIPIALLIGCGAGIIAGFGPALLERARIDDVTGALPAHLGAGIWGTLAVPLAVAKASFALQGLGVICVGAFVFLSSLVLFLVLQILFGLRTLPERVQASSGGERTPERRAL